MQEPSLRAAVGLKPQIERMICLTESAIFKVLSNGICLLSFCPLCFVWCSYLVSPLLTAYALFVPSVHNEEVPSAIYLDRLISPHMRKPFEVASSYNFNQRSKAHYPDLESSTAGMRRACRSSFSIGWRWCCLVDNLVMKV